MISPRIVTGNAKTQQNDRESHGNNPTCRPDHHTASPSPPHNSTGRNPKIAVFSKNGISFRPPHTHALPRLLEPAGRAQVESGHRESVWRGRGDHQTSPGHRTMSLGHPRPIAHVCTHCTRPQRFCTRFVTYVRFSVPGVISIDIADHMKTCWKECSLLQKNPRF